jgi:hypothetical protein
MAYKYHINFLSFKYFKIILKNIYIQNKFKKVIITLELLANKDSSPVLYQV